MVLLCLVSETPFVRGDASKSCCVIEKVLLQFELDAVRTIEKCGCAQLPREELDRLTRKAVELKRKYSS